MPTVKAIFEALADIAPVHMKEDFDNVGFLVGEGGAEVTRVLVSLDVTLEVAEEAKRRGAQLIVAHHPVFFNLKNVTDETPTGRLIGFLIRNGIAAISMHTNLDKAAGGVNDMLAAALELCAVEPLICEGSDTLGQPYGLGRIGHTETTDVAHFVPFVAEKLGCKGIRYADAGLPVRRVAVGGGSCGDFIPKAIEAGCDTFVTADLKYNMFLSAADQGINLIDAGHYPTENVVCPRLREVLRAAFPGLTVELTADHREYISYWAR